MTEKPDNIPQFVGDDYQLLNALRHMLTRKNLTDTDKAVVNGAIDTIEGLIDAVREMSEYD
ncbi:hypothetical protein [Phaeobacter italicus]|jgi:hypothetical protein|uniref:hypothetical protein n=1 Tax=Phaeobacter italicus TaxID=481446 RepID=UPI002FDE06AA